ncbi:MAG: tetratricopeptide repeat protein, partial [Myxococcota bacterium]
MIHSAIGTFTRRGPPIVRLPSDAKIFVGLEERYSDGPPAFVVCASTPDFNQDITSLLRWIRAPSEIVDNLTYYFFIGPSQVYFQEASSSIRKLWSRRRTFKAYEGEAQASFSMQEEASIRARTPERPFRVKARGETTTAVFRYEEDHWFIEYFRDGVKTSDDLNRSGSLRFLDQLSIQNQIGVENIYIYTNDYECLITLDAYLENVVVYCAPHSIWRDIQVGGLWVEYLRDDEGELHMLGNVEIIPLYSDLKKHVQSVLGISSEQIVDDTSLGPAFNEVPVHRAKRPSGGRRRAGEQLQIQPVLSSTSKPVAKGERPWLDALYDLVIALFPADGEFRRLMSEHFQVDDALPESGLYKDVVWAALVTLAKRDPSYIQALFELFKKERPRRQAIIEPVHQAWRDRDPAEDPFPLDGILRPPQPRRPPEVPITMPSVLLQADYRIVPFFGRESELDALRAWLDGDVPPVSVQLIHGPGGAGKTRLLLELCAIQRKKGWDAGFLQDRPATSVVDAIRTAARHRLIVIDYAETRRSIVTDILAAFADEGLPFGRLRVVLLAREAGQWWGQLGANDAGVLRIINASPSPIRLAPLFPDVDARADYFRRAVEVFAQQTGRSAPTPLVVPSLADDALGQPLYLWMSALAALEDRHVSDAPALLDITLKHELRVWRRTIDGPLLDGLMSLDDWLVDFAVPVMAAVTLLGGTYSQDEAVELIEAVADFEHVGRARGQRLRVEMAEMFERLYPWLPYDPGRIGGLMPDVLGEHLVAMGLDRRPEVLAILLDGDWQRQAHILTVLNRLAARVKAHEQWLRDALLGREAELIETCQDVAIESGDPIGLIVAERLRQAQDPDSAMRLVPKLSRNSTAFEEAGQAVVEQAMLAVSLFDQRLEMRSRRALYFAETGDLMQAHKESGALIAALRTLDKPFNLAGMLRAHAAILFKLGRYREARSAIDECIVRMRRAMAPGPRHILLLSLALGTQGIILAKLGLHQKAIASSKESLLLARLLDDNGHEKAKQLLASLQNNLGDLCETLGQLEAAYTFAERAVDIRRAQADEVPDAFLPQLALALASLGSRCLSIGKFERAEGAYTESISIYRSLSARRPDKFFGALVNAQIGLGSVYYKRQTYRQAAEYMRPVVEQVRRFERQGGDAWDVLTMALTLLGEAYCAAEQPQEGLKHLEEAKRSLDVVRNQTPELVDLSMMDTLRKLGVRQQQVGQHQAARKTLAEAETVLRAHDTPSAMADVWLAKVLIDKASIHYELDEIGEADDSMREAIRMIITHRQLFQSEDFSSYFPVIQAFVDKYGASLKTRPELSPPELSPEASTQFSTLLQPQPPARGFVVRYCISNTVAVFECAIVAGRPYFPKEFGTWAYPASEMIERLIEDEGADIKNIYVMLGDESEWMPARLYL